jgi:ATP-dependent DNA helicase DinG
VVAARIAQAEKNGGNPFMDYQLPHAAICLKQGAGRLIRTETDRGVLMICDTRLADKPYGKLLLNALPPMTRTRKLDVVERFFAAEGRGSVAAPAVVEVLETSQGG